MKPGVPQGKLRAVAASKRGPHRHHDHVLARSRRVRRDRVPRRDGDRAPAGDGVPQPRASRSASHDERPGHEQHVTFHNDAGIVDFVRHLNQAKEPLFKDVGSFTATEPEGEVEVAWQWNTGYHEGLHSVRERHLDHRGRDARGGLQARAHAGDQPLREGAQPAEGEGRDASRATTFARGSPRSCRCGSRDPQFEGQTKAKLGNTEIRSLVERLTNERFGRWLEEHPNPGEGDRRQGVERGARPAARRSRRASSRAARPRSKAWACPTSSPTARPRDRDDTELFIVEGDSAGRFGARHARDPKNAGDPAAAGQDPQRRARPRWTRSSPTPRSSRSSPRSAAGIGTDFDLAKVRYGKVIVLADADVDGGHIRTLLITFFYRQMTAAGGRRAGSTSRSRRSTRSRSAARRSTSPTTRAGCRSIGGAPEPPAAVRAVQGPRRDGLRPSCARRAWIPRRVTSCASTSTRPRSRDERALGAHGRRRRSAAQLDPAERQGRPFPRRCRRPVMARRKSAAARRRTS